MTHADVDLLRGRPERSQPLPTSSSYHISSAPYRDRRDVYTTTLVSGAKVKLAKNLATNVDRAVLTRGTTSQNSIVRAHRIVYRQKLVLDFPSLLPASTEQSSTLNSGNLQMAITDKM